MNNKPTFVRGTGRGRGAQLSNSSASNGSVWQGKRMNGQQQPDNTKSVINNGSCSDHISAEKRFEKISQKHRESAQQHMKQVQQNEQFSDEEEELKDDIVESIFKSYTSQNVVDDQVVHKAQDGLLHSFKSATSACLVCIESIKNEEPVWSCHGCAGIFHIFCIQKWIKEGVYQMNYKSDTDLPSSNIPWHCPKCRLEYQQKDFPTRYYCFCGKIADPPFDPWLVPHSCGQTCGRRLKPDCGHTCLLLCHPGPCPPCPKTIKSKCYCGKKEPQMKRCSDRYWACNGICGRLLSCGQHNCQEMCHEGSCSPCSKTSKQLCNCGRHKEMRPCASPKWKCKELCNKSLNCGNHACEKVCHTGVCGECPRLGLRTCPCGKTEFKLPCTEDIQTCGDTCEKLLSCGQHKCLERCHTGPCSPCQHQVVKRCRCGRKQKESLCSKEFTCDSKCNRKKNCGQHQCKKKCCKGNCAPCDQICGKLLSCKNHKCASPCHFGPCYPCPLNADVKCFCKYTKVTVPCGKEKNVKKPKCNQPCQIPPTCHHSSRTRHRCHFGSCPPCRQICALQLDGCNHACPALCHDEVEQKTVQKVVRKNPWDPLPEEKINIVKLSCPPCQVSLPQDCLGGHETIEVPCHKLGPYSCGQPCGRQLPCTNHTCTKQCHKVEGASDEHSAGTNCLTCEEFCMKPRPEGCNHSCPEQCHPGPCPPCSMFIKMKCHCQSIFKHIPCVDWAGADFDKKAALRSCGARCPRDMACGHRCLSPCHVGTCPEVQCKQLITVQCRCKRNSKQTLCFEYNGKKRFLDCDKICEQIKAEKKAKVEETERLKKEEQERKDREEVEAFERKKKGRGRKPRKEYEEVIEPSWLAKNGKTLMLTFGGIISFIFFCFFVYSCIE